MEYESFTWNTKKTCKCKKARISASGHKNPESGTGSYVEAFLASFTRSLFCET
jgi:hypothetical protein